MTVAAALLVLIVTLVSLIARRGVFPGRVLIIGNSPLARQLVTEFTAQRQAWHRVSDVVDDSGETGLRGGDTAHPGPV